MPGSATLAGTTDAVVAAAAVPTKLTADDVVTHRPGPSIGWLNIVAAFIVPVVTTLVSVVTPGAAK